MPDKPFAEVASHAQDQLNAGSISEKAESLSSWFHQNQGLINKHKSPWVTQAALVQAMRESRNGDDETLVNLKLLSDNFDKIKELKRDFPTRQVDCDWLGGCNYARDISRDGISSGDMQTFASNAKELNDNKEIAENLSVVRPRLASLDADKDGLIQRSEFETLVTDPSVPKEMRNAARAILAEPVWNKVANTVNDEWGDETAISKDDVRAFIGNQEAGIKSMNEMLAAQNRSDILPTSLQDLVIKRFALLDLNGNKSITYKELETALASPDLSAEDTTALSKLKSPFVFLAMSKGASSLAGNPEIELADLQKREVAAKPVVIKKQIEAW